MKKDILGKNDYRKDIISCFNKLLIDNDIKDISVKDICSNCHISKKIFYTYYSSINDIVRDINNNVTYDFYKRIIDFDFITNMDKIIAEYFIYLEETNFDKKIKCSINLDLIKDNILNDYNDRTYNIIYSYFKGSIEAIYNDWINNNRVVSIFRIIEISITLINNGIRNII